MMEPIVLIICRSKNSPRLDYLKTWVSRLDANYLRNLLESDGATGSRPLRANLDSHWCIVHLAFEM